MLAELDYLTAQLAGVDAELTLLGELSSGAYELASFGVDDLIRASPDCSWVGWWGLLGSAEKPL